MLEERLNVDRSNAQHVISLVLSVHALVCVVVGPLTGHIADRISSRKGALLVSLSCELVGTIIVAAAPSGMLYLLSIWLFVPRVSDVLTKSVLKLPFSSAAALSLPSAEMQHGLSV